MSELRISRRAVAVATAISIGAAGIGYEVAGLLNPSKRVISERVLSEKVDYSAGIDIVVSGRYGTPEHNQSFVSHYNVSCEESPNGVGHSETVIGDSYSMEAFIDEVPDTGELCDRPNAYSKKRIQADTNAVLAKFDYHFGKAHPDLGIFYGAATRIDFPHSLAGLFRGAIAHDATDGFGVMFDPKQKQSRFFQALKDQVLEKVGNENVYINVREPS